MKRLLILIPLLAGCTAIPVETVTPTPAPTPLVIYVTPAPTPLVIYVTPEPTPEPTPTPKPTPTPRPVITAEPGTPYLDYLNWALGAQLDISDLFGTLADSKNLNQMINRADNGYPTVQGQRLWLDNHPPQACYANVWGAYSDEVDAMLNMLNALRNGDINSALYLMNAVQTTLDTALATTDNCSVTQYN